MSISSKTHIFLKRYIYTNESRKCLRMHEKGLKMDFNKII